MRMNKPSSMTTVLSRTCPHCFTMIDPIWYGWHISKCSVSNNQGIDTSTTLNKNEADNAQLVVFPCEVGSGSLPPSCTLSLAPDSQFIEENHSKGNATELIQVSEPQLLHLSSEKQILADRVKGLEIKLKQLEEQFKAEKQALTDKVKDLELDLKDMEYQLRISKESEGKALRMVGLLRCGLDDALKHGKEVGIYGLPMDTTTVEMTSLPRGLDDALKHSKKADICSLPLETTTVELTNLYSAKQSMELANEGIIPCINEGEEVRDWGDSPAQVKEQVKGSILTEQAVNSKPSVLDHIVGLACAGGPVSLDFLSSVDEFIKNHTVFPSTQDASETQNTQETTQNASNEEHGQDISAKSDQPLTTKKRSVFLATCPNGTPPTLVPDEERHTAATDAPRTPFGFSNDENAGAKPNGYTDKTNDYGQPVFDSHAVVSEMHCPASEKDTGMERRPVLSHETFLANHTHSHSCASSLELGYQVVKVKAGPRRIVLSDSESEGGNMQPACDGGDHQDVCPGIYKNYSNKRLSNLPYEQNDDESDGNARNIHTEIANIRVNQPYIQQVKVVQGMDNGEDGKHTGIQRSKRLRRLAKSQNEEQDAPSSMKIIPCTLVAASSSAQTSSSSPTLVANTDAHKKSIEMTLDMQTTPSSRHRLRRRLEVPSSTSAGSSSQVEEFVESMSQGSSDSQSKAVEFVRERSRRPLEACKRLFAEVESKPAIGSKHSTGNEEDDSEIESDADSLKDFIVYSEDTEDSRSSSDGCSSSRTLSSKEVYCNPRFERDLKIRHYVWELEAEMLAAFAVNPELCLRAVCAINRRQTEDEQKEKMSKYLNKRGFDKLHAKRGSRIADFLTDGDPSGPVKKLVKDLEKFDAGSLELCKMLAAMHSKQLFEIYKNAEDPHFPFA